MDNLRGATLMVFAMAMFAIEDALIKALAVSMPTGQVLIIMGICGFSVFALWCRSRRIPVVNPVFFNCAVMVRNLSEGLGAVAYVTALTLIPLAVASAFIQAAPLMMTLVAALFLGEQVGWRRWMAIAVGFGGGLLILRPFGAGFDPNALWALLGVVFLSARDLASRRVPRDVPSVLLAAYGFATLIPAGLALLPFGPAVTFPQAQDWLALAAIVTVGLVGYLAITTASRAGDVSFVTPFRYTRLPFALVLGYAMFGERPDTATLAGAALIVTAGMYTLIREARLRRR